MSRVREWRRLAACAAGALASTSAALAQEWGGSLVATSNYIFQGLSRSDHDVALQGDLHWRGARGEFLGAWASTADSATDGSAGLEVNLYAGRAWALSPRWTASANYARYWYPDAPSHAPNHDHDQWLASLSFEDRATVALGYAPNVVLYSYWANRLRKGREWSYEASFHQRLWREVALTTGVGYYDLSDLFRGSYWAWNGGLTLVRPHLQLTVARFSAQAVAHRVFGPKTADGRWAFTAAWRF